MVDLDHVTTEAMKAIETIAKLTDEDTYALITEDEFVVSILPLLKREEGHQKDAGVWLDLAGTATRGFIVTDATGEQELFRVPPLLRNNDIKINIPAGYSFNEIISTAAMKRNVMPRLGDRYIENMLTKNVSKTRVDLEAIEQLNYIFDRYGLEPPYKKVTPKEKTPTGESDLEVTEYEDF